MRNNDEGITRESSMEISNFEAVHNLGLLGGGNDYDFHDHFHPENLNRKFNRFKISWTWFFSGNLFHTSEIWIIVGIFLKNA